MKGWKPKDAKAEALNKERFREADPKTPDEIAKAMTEATQTIPHTTKTMRDIEESKIRNKKKRKYKIWQESIGRKGRRPERERK